MKKILFILSFLTCLVASAQIDTTKQIQTISANGYAYKHLQAIYALILPTDTLQMKSDWRGIAFKGTSPYYWSGTKWNAFGTGGGSADSAVFATMYRLDSVKANLRTEIALNTPITRFLDSLLAHTSRFDAVTTALAGKQATLVSGTNIKTVNGNSLLGSGDVSIAGGSGDTSTFIVDTLNTALAMVIGTDTVWLRSVRFSKNGTLVTPTLTDSTAAWNFTIDTTDITSFSVKVRALFSATGPLTYANGNISLDTTSGKWRSEAYYDTKYALIGGGGGGSPSGNFGNIQINRNGAFATPGTDSLDFDAGLNIKGALSATALPTGGVDADSLVVITSAGAFKKRSKSAFAPNLTATYIAYGSAGGTLTGSSGLVFNAGAYPTMGIVGTNPLLYFGAVSSNSPSFGSASGAVIYGGGTYKSINFYDQTTSPLFLARFYSSGGTIYNTLNGLITSNTLSSPSNYQGSFSIQRTVPYNAGLNYHGYTDQTVFNSQSTAFNSFGSFVTFGNDRFTQNHYAAFQSVWYKDSSNTMGKVYDFVSAVSEHREGTIDTLFRYKVFPVTVTGGATLSVEYGIHLPAGSATTNYGAYIEDNVGIGIATPTEKLHVNGNIKTADPGSGAGAWKLGTLQTTSGLTLNTTNYVEVSIGGTVYRLAIVDPPVPQP